MRHLKISLFFVFVLLALGQNLADTQPPQVLDQDAWQELTEDLDYTETEPQPKKKTREFRLPNLNLNTTFFKYLFFSVILILLIYVLIRYVRALQSNARVKQALQVDVTTLQQAEKNPLKANLTKLIEDLVAAQQYREATRAYFLLVLQRMHLLGLIQWEKPKTNFDYVKALSGSTLHPSFSQLTYYFEIIWYGQQQVDRNQFKSIEPEFINLLRQLQSDEE